MFFFGQSMIWTINRGGANFAPPPSEKRCKKCLMKLGLKLNTLCLWMMDMLFKIYCLSPGRIFSSVKYNLKVGMRWVSYKKTGLTIIII